MEKVSDLLRHQIHDVIVFLTKQAKKKEILFTKIPQNKKEKIKVKKGTTKTIKDKETETDNLELIINR